ncbi:phospholipase D-like domain-containing protein [Marinobacterium lutimaris]|uniref:Phosphatidylserine/phosphatidylglycerophosphate/cardiolipin synthase n=1 Tax=Marinobacterium lutimaris TaxID=568106 RepID=A0A1H5TZ38_9GAMM|nr:phospholipase D-like domain-containing protein [Marinobacterium lutimaris]SEF68142.1 Phosphatidylserine/phosphatidylglycerophosphate/cardiolipin synthase [Marinobacterium lutimaris]
MSRIRAGRPRFGWRDGNSVELFVDGEHFFPEMIYAIQSAQQSVMLEMYLCSSGIVMNRFIAALAEAVGRGVKVFLLLDHYGARGLVSEDRQRLKDAGIQLGFYNPVAFSKWSRNFARDHRKLLVVDRRCAFIGGAGLTDDYAIDQPRKPETPWHELMCRVEGPVVHDMAVLFRHLWWRVTAEHIGLGPELSPQSGIGAAQVRLLSTAGLANQSIKISTLKCTARAKERVWICTAYFLPSFSLRRSLRRAARQGLDVRLLVAGPLTDHRWIYYASKRFYRRLLNAGVRIYEYQPRMLHAKVALFDERVSVGSCNLDHWNLRWNLEANIEVCEPGFTREVEQLFETDFGDSVEVDAVEWEKRPWYRKVRETVWALICQWILRIR